MQTSAIGSSLTEPMNSQPHQRKAEINLNKAEKLRHQTLVQNHPEWVRKNGDCPSCISLEHEMADTARPDLAENAMKDFGQ